MKSGPLEKMVKRLLAAINPIICALFYVVQFLVEVALGMTIGQWVAIKFEHVANVVSGGLFDNACEVDSASFAKRFAVYLFKRFVFKKKTSMNWWTGRDAYKRIGRGKPDYSETLPNHQSQDKYYAHERLCGNSPWGTGGKNGLIFVGISMLALLQWSVRSICLLYLQGPCKCSWRGCAWCKTKVCLVSWDVAPNNDGAVSMSSCQTWGEGTHFTYMAINHDDGTMRLEDHHLRNDQKPLKYFKNLVDQARDDSQAQQDEENESGEGGERRRLVSLSTWYARKPDQVVPFGDRDGSTIWTEVERAGSVGPADMEWASDNSYEKVNRLLTFDEHTRLFTLHYSTVSEKAHGVSNPDRIGIHLNHLVMTGSSKASDGTTDANSYLGGSIHLLASQQTFIPQNLPPGVFGRDSPVYGSSEEVGVESGWGEIFRPEVDKGGQYKDLGNSKLEDYYNNGHFKQWGRTAHNTGLAFDAAVAGARAKHG
jgi:hypothetical protein